MDPLAPLISALHSEGRLRVWSLVITVFGDLVQHRGGEISTARLRMLLGRVGVENGALRTALSRLAADGWVTSERAGRNSIYRLSIQGLTKFAPATTRIYAPPRVGPVSKWALVATLGENGSQTLHLCPAEEVIGKGDCCVVGDLEQVSGVFRQSLMDETYRQALQALATDLSALRRELDDPLDAAAARMLLIHRWRRIVLRFPDVAAEIMPADTPLRDPRGAVAQSYFALSPAAETWLSGSDDGLQPLPEPAHSQVNRFGKPLRA